MEISGPPGAQGAVWVGDLRVLPKLVIDTVGQH